MFGKKCLAIILVLIAAFLGWYFLLRSETTPSVVDAKKVTFLIAHQPVSVFEESNKIFARELSQRTNGTLELEVLTPADFGVEGRDISRDEIAALMSEGKVHVSSAQTRFFESDVPHTNVFSVPFAFEGYEDLSAFFESPQGLSILDEVTNATNFEALAFTFSGGFRVIGLTDESNPTMESLQGVVIASAGGENTFVKDAFEILGADVLAVRADTTASDLEKATGVEVTYTRISHLLDTQAIASIVETQHGELVTLLIADDTFVAELSENEKQALIESARIAAVAERADSVSLAQETRERLIDKEIKIYTPSDEEKSILKKKGKEAAASYTSVLRSELLEVLFSE